MRTTTRSASGPRVDFANPPGAPAYLAPDSMHWRIYKNPIALTIGGVCAVLLEFADPRIRTGVWEHSVYKQDPIGRSERTGMAAMVGVYGPKESAEKMIAGITRMHAKVGGETPGGRPYQALEPELLNWVYATASYGFMTAYHRFVKPLTAEEQHRFWNSGGDLAALYGVTHTPKSEADFLAMMDALAPGFEPHAIVGEFLEIVESGKSATSAPRFIRRALARGAVSILPPLVREKLALGRAYDLTWLDRLTLKILGRIAERRFDPESAPARASERLGLPADYLWRKPDRQRELAGDNPRRETPESMPHGTRS